MSEEDTMRKIIKKSSTNYPFDTLKETLNTWSIFFRMLTENSYEKADKKVCVWTRICKLTIFISESYLLV